MQAFRNRVESLRNDGACPLLGMRRVEQDGWGRRRHERSRDFCCFLGRDAQKAAKIATPRTHLFHTQIINRVDQSGQVTGGATPVDPIELGWKDTIRVNPLEITYLALRPIVPTAEQIPFEVPDSVRLIDPTLPEGATLIPPPPAGWFDPDGVPITEILNHPVNFGWEYVWHCHILSHEEMDMMHSLVFAVPPREATNLAAAVAGTDNNPRVNLSWTDNSSKETQFTLQRASDANFTTGLRAFTVPAAAGSGTTVAFADTTVSPNNSYWYKVFAKGATVGDTQQYAGSSGFPTLSADSVSATQQILVGAAPGTPTAPTGLTATLQTGPRVSLTWSDNATNETGFAVERCAFVAPATTCSNFVRIATAAPRNNTGNVTYEDATVTFGNTYLYRVAAVNGTGLSAYSPVPPVIVSVTVPAIPAVPTSLTVSAVKANGNNYTATLNWGPVTWPGPQQPTNFTIQRATNATFTANLNTATVAGNLRTSTQTVNRNTTYYYRIRANNTVSGSSAWKNAQPFPIRTGP